MDLIVISNPFPVPHEISVLMSLFAAGLRTFHLRKPGFSLNEMKTYIKSVAPEYRSRIVLHTHWELGRQFTIKGFHGSAIMPDSVSTRKMTRSCSLHSLEKLESADQGLDYVFLSPVFDSISKRGYRAGFKHAALESRLKLRAARGRKPAVIALGGINTGNIELVSSMGFDGAAVLGAVWPPAAGDTGPAGQEEGKENNSVEKFIKLQEVLCPTLSS